MKTPAMNATLHPQRSPRSRPLGRFGGLAALFALLGGPLAWFAHLLISYGLVYVPCAIRLPLLLLTTLTMAAIAIAAAIVSWRFVRESSTYSPNALQGGRTRFIGYGGTLNSLLFLLIILAQGVTPLVLGGCG